MTDIPFTVFSCLGFVLCIPPAYFNWKIPGRPWATLIFIGWICVFNGFSFIDSIIWSGPDPAEWWDGKVYCDIFSRVKSVFQIGLPAAGIGICRFLADATNPDPATTDLAHTRFRRNMIDLFLGVGLPLINIGLKVIVNPTRFCILGVSGCNGITDLSWPAVLLYHVWCPVLSCIAGIYAGSFPFAQKVYVVIFLRHWWVRRKRLNEEWGTGTRRGISRTEFRRLQFTILSVIFFYLPFSLWYFVQVVKLPKIPFSWDRIHGPQWEYITKISMPKANLSQWLGPVMAFTSFFFIGLTRNARVFYEHRVEWIYDHLPKRLQEKLPGMQKTSRLCKERRAAKETYRYGEDRNISMVERYVPESAF